MRGKGVVKLTVIQPDEIRHLSDIFRCVPYSASISAQACASRRQKALRLADLTPKERWMSDRAMIDRSKCTDCALGASVEAAAARAVVTEPAGGPADFVRFTEAGVALLRIFAARPDRDEAELRAAITSSAVDNALSSGRMRRSAFVRLCPELFNSR